MSQALPLAIFVRKVEDGVREVRREIEKDVGKGIITPERAEELQGLVDVVMRWHKTHGYVEERLDPHDWVSLGNGGHMRVKHLDENYEAPRPRASAISNLESLLTQTKENEDEES